MRDSEFLKDFITVKLEKHDTKVHSAFSMALHHARLITGRDIETGESKHYLLKNRKYEYLKPYSPIGILNYLIVLELIGKIFMGNKTNDEKTGIPAALSQFSELNEEERFTIDAFRNGLAHGYSLVNIPRNKSNNKNSRHKFVYALFGNDIPLIEYPENPWNGEFNEQDEHSNTRINVGKLFNLIEDIISKVHSGIENNEIKLKIEMPELKSRYLLSSYP